MDTSDSGSLDDAPTSSYGLDSFLRDAGGIFSAVTTAQVEAAKAKSAAQITTAQAQAQAAQTAATKSQINSTGIPPAVLYIGGGILVLILVIALVFKK